MTAAWVVSITALAFLIQLTCAQEWRMGHDEILHVLYPAVQPLRAFIAEIKYDTHPPLTYLLLRPWLPLQGSPVWPRLMSIVPGTLLVPTLFLTARRLGVAAPLCLTGAFFLAVSYAHTSISVVVRSYALAMFFVMGAHLLFLEVLGADGRPAPLSPSSPGARGRLALMLAAALLGMLSLYAAALAVAAMAGAVLLLGIGDRGLPRRVLTEVWAQVGKVEAVAFVAGLAGLAAFWSWTRPVEHLDHVARFFPGPGEGIPAFAVRGIASSLSAFASVPIPPGPWSVAAAASAAAGWFVVLALQLARGARARAAVLLITAELWVVLFVLSILGIYPFGGDVRHQYVLFPFTVVAALLVLDEALMRLSSPWARRALCTAAAAAAVLSSALGFSGPRLDDHPDRPLYGAEYGRLRAEMEHTEAVFVSRYGVLGIFGNTMDWSWTLAARFDRSYDVFHVRRGEELLVVVRDRSTWTFPPPDARLAADVARVMEGARLRSLWVWSTSPDGAGPEPRAEPDVEAFREHRLELGTRLLFTMGEAFRVRAAPR